MMWRGLLLAFGVFVIGLQTAEASTWLWGNGQKKTANGPAGAILAPQAPTGSGALPPYMANPDGNGFGTSSDIRKRSKEDQQMLAREEAAQQAANESLLDDLARRQAEAVENARINQLNDQRAALEAQRQQLAEGSGVRPAPVAGVMPAPVAPAATRAVTGTVVAPQTATTNNPIKPYIVSNPPVKQWDAINKNAQEPGIKPYVVVPRSDNQPKKTP